MKRIIAILLLLCATTVIAQEKKDDTLVEAVLRDWRTAPLDPKLRATLGFLEKLTLAPTEVGPADVKPLRAAGVSDGVLDHGQRARLAKHVNEI